MAEFTIPKKSFVVTSIKRGRIDDLSLSVSTNVVTIMGNPLAHLPRLGTITPLEFDSHYGVGSDPTDSTSEWWLVMVDIDNLPTRESVRALSIWNALQNWRSIGTDSGPTQTVTHAEVDFLNTQSYSFTEMADFTQRMAVCLLGLSNGSIAMLQVGVLTYAETIIQRVFGSDNWTFELDPWGSEFGDEWGNDMSDSG